MSSAGRELAQLGRRERAEERGEDGGLASSLQQPNAGPGQSPQSQKEESENEVAGRKGRSSTTGREPPLDLRAQGFWAPPQEVPGAAALWAGLGGPRGCECSHLLLESHGPAWPAGSSDPQRPQVCSPMMRTSPGWSGECGGSRSWLGRSAQRTPRLLGGRGWVESEKSPLPLS